VLANVSSDLAALYDRVKRTIKPAAGTSRTEAFLKWAEAHPDAVLAATAHPADVAVRELEADVASTSRRLNPYEARKAARIERTKARAASLERAAESAHASAKAVADRIPMGQPILVGHHSERRHRRDIGRIQGGFTKAAELHREAETLRRRAAHAESSVAVSSDDPDAIAKLRAKVEQIDRDRARMVAANKAVRSKAPREALSALGFSDTMIERALTPDFAGRLGFPDYVLRNAASEAARVRKRIADLEARATRRAPEPIVLPGVRVEEAENRVRILFDTKPDDTVHTALKRAGFRWSPSVGAWQRHASNGAWYEAKRIAGEGVTRPVEEMPKPTVKGEGLDTTQIAARIRDDIKEAVRSGALPKAKYSVRTDKYSMGSSVTVVASSLPFEVLNPDAFVVERGANWMTFDRVHHRSRFTPEAEALEQKLNAIVDAYHWNRSDSSTDYYNERFARHVEVKENEGAWKRVELAKIAAARAAEERV
jgi:cell division septum initiation protein DivIVA